MKAQLWLSFVHASAALRALSASLRAFAEATTNVLAVLYHLKSAYVIWKAERR